MLSTVAVILAVLLALELLGCNPLGSFIRMSCSWTGAGSSGKFHRRGSRTIGFPARKARFLLGAIRPMAREDLGLGSISIKYQAFGADECILR
jgi:hypothetical protein